MAFDAFNPLLIYEFIINLSGWFQTYVPPCVFPSLQMSLRCLRRSCWQPQRQGAVINKWNSADILSQDFLTTKEGRKEKCSIRKEHGK